jgi:small-conductance mechanosensitive channel
VLAIAVVAVAEAVATTSDDLSAACGAPGHRRWLCKVIWEHSDSYGFARLGYYLTPWVSAALIIVAALVAFRLARLLIRRAVHRLIAQRPGADGKRGVRRAEAISGALLSLTAIVITTVTVFAVIAAFGIDIGPLLAGAGLAGIVIGFGAQNLMRDVIAGGFMVFEDQLGVGDRIDAGPVTGVVENVTLRVTSLRDDRGVMWHVPNGTVTRIANLSQRQTPTTG